MTRAERAGGAVEAPRPHSAPHPAPVPRRALAVLLALWAGIACLYVAASTVPVVFDETEGQYAGAAREMWNADDWMVPTNDGIPRLNKPPLFYWSILASYSLFGVDEFGARLPMALATLLWLAAIYLIGRELGGVEVAGRAVFLLATTFGCFVFSHVIMPEPLFAAFLSFTVWTFLRALRSDARASAWLTLAWVFMGLASLTKGLHGAAYPLLIAGIGAWLRPQTRPVFRKLLQWRGPLLFLLVLAPWYAYVEHRFPGFLRDQLWNEQIGHIFDKRWPPDSSRVPLMAFLFEHGVLFLPWVLFVPALVHARRRLPAIASRARRANAVVLLWIWPIMTLLSVLFSARQDYYTLTCWGALAVLLALETDRLGSLPRSWRITPPAILATVGALLMVGFFVVRATLANAPAGAIPAAQRSHALETIRGFSSGEWLRVSGPMLGAGLALLLSGIAATWLAARRRIDAMLASIAVGMLGLLAVVAWALSIVEQQLSLESAARSIERVAEPDGWVVYQGEPHRASSLFFYLDRPVHWLDSTAYLEFGPRVYGIGADLFLDEQQFETAWGSSRPVYLITEEVKVPHWREALGLSARESTPIGRSGTRVVLRNDAP
jgi:4-amino-4-deoxy-L-arabinose transferase-like glycosyltransferase